MESKSLEPEDYGELTEGLKAFTYGMAVTLGSGFQAYIPHHHRRWEYASAIQAYLETFGAEAPKTVLDIGCGSGPLGPCLYATTNALVTEIDPDEKLLETAYMQRVFIRQVQKSVKTDRLYLYALSAVEMGFRNLYTVMGNVCIDCPLHFADRIVLKEKFPIF